MNRYLSGGIPDRLATRALLFIPAGLPVIGWGTDFIPLTDITEHAGQVFRFDPAVSFNTAEVSTGAGHGHPYRHSRSLGWLKFKCVKRRELVIGGHTDPGGQRVGFGALLLGYYRNDTLHYAGKVGTSFDAGTLQALADRLAARTRGALGETRTRGRGRLPDHRHRAEHLGPRSADRPARIRHCGAARQKRLPGVTGAGGNGNHPQG